MKLFSIETGWLKLDGGAMFGVIPKIMWEKVYPTVDGNYTKWAMRCLLIDTGKELVLIDSGVGNKQDGRFRERFMFQSKENSLENSFEKAGYRFDDVTHLIHTHLHFDHCGGSIKYDEAGNLVPAFKNAKYIVSKAQWKLAQNANYFEKASFLPENILPMKEHGVLQLIENNCQITENIRVEIFNGHTKGQLIPHIDYFGNTIVYCGDFFPSAAHVPMAWVMAYDTQPLTTLKEKELFFKIAIENDYTLFFEHDAYSECAKLINTDKGIKTGKTFSLKDFLNSINY
jgi:glyoxylase-like metal-dependent hydrolase (beta-lactamase superfamily II)